MLEREWRLQYAGTDYSWGGIDPVNNPFRRPLGAINKGAPEVTDTELITEDAARPRQDGISFGQDYRAGRSWTFSLGFKGTSPADTRALLAAAEKAWRGDGVRMIPGRMASLTTRVGGQERTIYGRPRRFAPSRDLLHASEASALATFDQMDDVFYGAEESLRIDLAASASGGFAFPVTFPLVMAATSNVTGAVTVAGDLPAWVAAEIHGPIVNPEVKQTGGWSLKLAATILGGAHVTLDARPWVRSILTDTGSGALAGKLARTGQQLAAAKLDPGPHEMVLRGTDVTGTAYVMLRWQPAYSSMN